MIFLFFSAIYSCLVLQIIHNLVISLNSHVDDIDLFPGAITERILPGATVGPTFACIIGRQFHNSRVGDRFWYERSHRKFGFTLGECHYRPQM